MKLGNTNYTLYNKILLKANLTMPPSFVQEFTKKLCIYKNILWFDQINLEEG